MDQVLCMNVSIFRKHSVHRCTNYGCRPQGWL